MNRRLVTGALVIGLWLVGLAALAHRALFHDAAEELARVGRLVAPGTNFYTVTRNGRQIGFASSKLDTTSTGIEISELRVTNPVPGSVRQRRETRTTVRLTRAFQATGFTLRSGPDSAPSVITGTVEGDSAVVIVTTPSRGRPRTRRVQITAPLMLSAEVPLVMALGHTLDIGQHYRFTIFDPLHHAFGEATVRVAAESLFVLSDSTIFDEQTRHWVSAHDTTVRAWRLEEVGGGAIDGWFDSGGRIVKTHRSGALTLQRTAYELAFENWSSASKRARRHRNANHPAPPRTIGTTSPTVHPTAHSALNRP